MPYMRFSRKVSTILVFVIFLLCCKDLGLIIKDSPDFDTAHTIPHVISTFLDASCATLESEEPNNFSVQHSENECYEVYEFNLLFGSF